MQRHTGDASRRISTSIRWPIDEYLRVKKAAQREHVSVSDYIRRHVPGATENRWTRRARV